MRKKVFCMAMLGLMVCVLSGCTSYYKVTDPRTEKVYYTTDINKRSNGAVIITDKKNNKKVTLQDSEIEKVSRDAYNVGIYSDKSK